MQIQWKSYVLGRTFYIWRVAFELKDFNWEIDTVDGLLRLKFLSDAEREFSQFVLLRHWCVTSAQPLPCFGSLLKVLGDKLSVETQTENTRENIMIPS